MQLGPVRFATPDAVLTLVEDLLTTALAARSSPAADTLVDAVLQTLPWVWRSQRVTFLDDTCSTSSRFGPLVARMAHFT